MNPISFAFSALVYAYFFYVFCSLMLWVYDQPTHVAQVDALFPRKVGAPASMGANSSEPAFSSRAGASVVEHGVCNIALFGVFVAQHVVMARPAFKAFAARFVPAYLNRSLFVLGASASLEFMMQRWHPLAAPDVWHVAPGSPLGMAINAAFFVVCTALLAATFNIDHFDLFGLRQGAMGEAYTQPRFVEWGFYRYVRHPLMFFFMCAFWLTPVMTRGRLLFAVISSIYICFIGVPLEERDLRHELKQYGAYARRVPGLCPFSSPRG